jgi:uncharacterized short protein YbdD (DUF466 family)
MAHVAEALRHAAAVVRRVVGVPDYERYAAHMRECHPEIVALTREEFELARLEDRYSRPGQRCC